jgi:glycosidase
MPDLNLDNPAVEEEVVEIMDYWLDVGVDGFRMDAARHYFETDDGVLVDVEKVHPVVKRIHRRIAKDHPDALLVAEVWSDVATVAPYYGDEGDEFQLAFGFDTASAILTSAKDRTVAAFEQNIRYQNEEYADVNYEAPFLTNHDMPRVMRQLNGDEGAMRVAAAALFAMPGTPFIYYGEEIGMRGGPDPRDEDKRTPMRWTGEPPGYGFTTAAMAWHEADEPEGVNVEAQRGVEDSLWTLYRDLVAVRTSQPALADGTSRVPAITTSARGATAVLREAGDERVLVLLNFDDAPTGRLLVEADGEPEVIFSEGVKVAPFVSTETTGTIEIPDLAGRAFAFIRLR